MHPALARARTRLPGARAEARWHGGASGGPVELVADTLVIDADHLRCSVIWRGCVVLSDHLAPLHVEAGLALPDHPVAWVARAETPRDPPANLAYDDDDDATQAVSLPAAERAALPFRRATVSDGEAPRPVAPESVLPFRPPGAAPSPPRPRRRARGASSS